MSSISSDENLDEHIEKTYQKKTQLEHILLRPDSYVGSIKTEEKVLWVYDSEKNSMIERKISYNPALYKIFDEILVNASDHKIRDSKMTCIKITIDEKNSVIKIWNNGCGVPVVIHKTEKVYVPTLIFGHLLTSTNFNDQVKKVVGGRNGYGAKLCNIFSTEFTIETSSKLHNKSFKQTWKSNMTEFTEPIITSCAKGDFTRVTFYPDLKRFGMTHLDKDIIDLFSRRAYDVAACTDGVTVYLNGQQLPVKCFKDYVDLYLKNIIDHNGEPLKVVYEKFSPRWEVAMTTSVNDMFTQVSFVNSIATTKGGTHVNYLTDQAATKLLEIAKKKIKDDKQAVKLKPAQVKMNIWIFVKALIENPSFDSQTKENMTLQSKDFGSTCVLTDKFINQAAKSGIVEKMTMWAQFKNQALMDKKCSKSKQSKLKGIPKLDDANNAGTKHSLNCTLILTEGDSAKTLAVAGLSVIGRDNYGVFPLRGKLLNVREASAKQLLENVEINNLIKILGLQYKQKYETPESMKTLRYGKIMIMTDQDQDGSHIKGLIINFIHTNWPNLLKNNFVEQFITPIIKATKGNNILSFFSIPEYNEWLNTFPDAKTYHIKYYKGLGTSTGKEAKEYFSDMNRHLIKFKYDGIEDEKCIILAFGKNKADERKEWLTGWMEECKRRKELGLEEEYLYAKNTKQVNFESFVRKELVLFSNADNERSIPSVVDGLKPGQRKVMFACFKRNLIKEIKVAQLAGSVAELSSYHHGEMSLMGTIVNLAQDFIGSNNINLLEPRGQFGTRLHGGKDSASARYIFTQLSRLSKLIFHPDDAAILNYLYDDNQKIEPEWYVPIIPMVLVNGSDGIGTGWSSKIHNYNPKDIILNIRNLIDDKPLFKMHPWYRGFRGTITEVCDNRYIISGEINSLGEHSLEITELPVKTWTQTYKENVVEALLNGSEKVTAAITDFKEYHTDTTVRFVVEMTQQKYDEAEKIGFHKFFKLQSSLTCNNMVLFDDLGVIKRYVSAEEILKDFFKVRMNMYIKRKIYLEGMLSAIALKLQNQARFIVEKIEGKIVCENVKIKAFIEMLVKRNYDSDPVIAWKKSVSKTNNSDIEDFDENDERDLTKPDFAYLTSMHIISLTEEKKDALIAESVAKTEELNRLKTKTSAELWTTDLDALEKALLEMEMDEKNQPVAPISGGTTTGNKKRGGKAFKIASETFPSKYGIRIAPAIDEEVIKKMTVDIVKKKKASNEKKQRLLMASQFSPQEDGDTSFKLQKMDNGYVDDDDDDDEPQSLVQRLAAQGITVSNNITSSVKPKEKKATETRKRKLPSSPLKKLSSPAKRRRKNSWSSDNEIAFDEDNLTENEDGQDTIQRDTFIKRSAAKNIKYNIPDDEDSPSSIVDTADATLERKDSDIFDPNSMTDSNDVTHQILKQIIPVTTDVVIDTTKKNKTAPKSKAAPKRKAPSKPKDETKTKPVPKNKPIITSDNDVEDIFNADADDDEPELPKKPRREVKKIISNVFDDSDDEEEEVNEDVTSDSDFDFELERKRFNGRKKAKVLH